MQFQKLSKGAIIALAIVGVLLTVTTAALLSSNQTLPMSGTITAVNLGVYSDSGCTQPATALTVGTISPGGNATQTMTANNWNPTNATSSLTLTWNQQNTVLTAGQSTQAILTLTAAGNTGNLTTFSCNVTLTGTQ